MIRLNTGAARYLDILAEGETILRCKRNKPIAEIRRRSSEEETPDRSRQGQVCRAGGILQSG
jgi:antitoxin (DNA-binding transcriptional repressor) of toxin-antitoxin stability system